MNIFDLHCDTLTACFHNNKSLRDNDLAVSFEQAGSFEHYSQAFAIFVDDDEISPFHEYCRVRDFYVSQEFPQNIKPILTVENGNVLEQNLNNLYVLCDDGVKVITLCWNGMNALASGCHHDGGLTHLGRAAIKEMNRLHIACDLSHINRQGFFEAAEEANTILATHSNCDAVFSHVRNLTDEQLKMIASKHGIIGICFYPAFLGQGDVFENMYKHIVHLCDLGLEKNIALGSDFDGADMDKRLSKLSDTHVLWENLCKRGLSEKLLKQIFWQNANDFFDKRVVL